MKSNFVSSIGARVTAAWSHLAVYSRLAWLGLFGRPYKLTLMVTDGCNLRCRICSIWQHPMQFMSFEEVKQIWEAFEHKPCWINISGGEPTLNPELGKMLEYFAEMRRSLLITLTTNGRTELTPILSRALEANRRSLVFVSVSMDGNASVHDQARGTSGSHTSVRRALDELRTLARCSYTLTYGVSTTLSRMNADRIIPFLARTIRQVPVSINLAQHSAYYHNRAAEGFEHLPRAELIQSLRALQFLQPKLSLSALLKVSFLESAIRWLQGSYSPLPCASVASHLLVTTDINLVDCTLHYRRWIPVALNREERLAAILRVIREPSARQKQLRDDICRRRCETYCHTPCEGYIHLISALQRPRYAPRLVATYLFRTLQSATIGPNWIRRAARDAVQHKSSGRKLSQVVSFPTQRHDDDRVDVVG